MDAYEGSKKPRKDTGDDKVLVFQQLDDLDIFLLDTTQTHGDPIFPIKGVNEYFTIAGFFQEVVNLATLRFTCEHEGVIVYNHTYDVENITNPFFGQFISDPYLFIIPSVAPDWLYPITVYG